MFDPCAIRACTTGPSMVSMGVSGPLICTSNRSFARPPGCRRGRSAFATWKSAVRVRSPSHHMNLRLPACKRERNRCSAVRRDLGHPAIIGEIAALVTTPLPYAAWARWSLERGHGLGDQGRGVAKVLTSAGQDREDGHLLAQRDDLDRKLGAVSAQEPEQLNGADEGQVATTSMARSCCSLHESEPVGANGRKRCRGRRVPGSIFVISVTAAKVQVDGSG